MSRLFALTSAACLVATEGLVLKGETPKKKLRALEVTPKSHRLSPQEQKGEKGDNAQNLFPGDDHDELKQIRSGSRTSSVKPEVLSEDVLSEDPAISEFNSINFPIGGRRRGRGISDRDLENMFSDDREEKSAGWIQNIVKREAVSKHRKKKKQIQKEKRELQQNLQTLTEKGRGLFANEEDRNALIGKFRLAIQQKEREDQEQNELIRRAQVARAQYEEELFALDSESQAESMKSARFGGEDNSEAEDETPVRSVGSADKNSAEVHEEDILPKVLRLVKELADKRKQLREWREKNETAVNVHKMKLKFGEWESQLTRTIEEKREEISKALYKRKQKLATEMAQKQQEANAMGLTLLNLQQAVAAKQFSREQQYLNRSHREEILRLQQDHEKQMKNLRKMRMTREELEAKQQHQANETSLRQMRERQAQYLFETADLSRQMQTLSQLQANKMSEIQVLARKIADHHSHEVEIKKRLEHQPESVEPATRGQDGREQLTLGTFGGRVGPARGQ
jgi:hypothetical protein